MISLCKTLIIFALALAISALAIPAQAGWLYAYRSGVIVGKAPAGNSVWQANKEARGFTVIEDDRDLDFSQYKVNGGEIVSKGEADLLPAAIVEKLTELQGNFHRFIETKPNGLARYSALNREQFALYPSNARVLAFNAWVQQVGAAYGALGARVQAAQSLAELDAIDVSYGAFEAAYGVDGTVAADPDVSFAELQ